MALIKPQEDFASRSNPQMQEGWHVAQCTAVDHIPPSTKYSKAKPRIVFRFEKFHPKGPCVGPEQAAYICSESVFLGNASLPESALVTLAKMVGYRNYQQGIDPERWKGRYFAIRTHHDGKSAWVKLISPCGEPEGRDENDWEVWEQMAIQSSPHYGKDVDAWSTGGGEAPF